MVLFTSSCSCLLYTRIAKENVQEFMYITFKTYDTILKNTTYNQIRCIFQLIRAMYNIWKLCRTFYGIGALRFDQCKKLLFDQSTVYDFRSTRAPPFPRMPCPNYYSIKLIQKSMLYLAQALSFSTTRRNNECGNFNHDKQAEARLEASSELYKVLGPNFIKK